MGISAVPFRRHDGQYRSECGRFTIWSGNAHGASFDRRATRNSRITTAAAKTWFLTDGNTGLTHDCGSLGEAKLSAAEIVAYTR